MDRPPAPIASEAYDPSATLDAHCGNGFDTRFQPLSKFLFQWILSCLLSVEPI
jgi:hypothetical protein